MRVSISTAILIASVCCVPVAASAAPGAYLCAVSEAYECLAVTGCRRVELKSINMSAFMLIDVEKKQMTSAAIGEAARSEDIEGLSATDKALYLHGTQDQETWHATVSLETGALAGGITSGESSFAFFGNCTPN
jgi:hypothetical protein